MCDKYYFVKVVKVGQKEIKARKSFLFFLKHIEI